MAERQLATNEAGAAAQWAGALFRLLGGFYFLRALTGVSVRPGALGTGG